MHRINLDEGIRTDSAQHHLCGVLDVVVLMEEVNVDLKLIHAVPNKHMGSSKQMIHKNMDMFNPQIRPSTTLLSSY